MDELVTRILLNVSHEHVLDICNVILLVLILLVADAFLRIIAEVFQYITERTRLKPLSRRLYGMAGGKEIISTLIPARLSATL